jgi:signal transduction histidine kinase
VRSTRASLVVVAGLLVGVAFLFLLSPNEVHSTLRHLYLLPVLLGAIRFGLRGGILVALLAVLLYAPVIFPVVGREGPTPQVGEGIVTIVLLLGVGTLTGQLRDLAKVKALRYRGLAELQHAMAGSGEFSELLERAITVLRRNERAHEISVFLRLPESEPMLLSVGTDGLPRWLKDASSSLRNDSAGAWVLGNRAVLYTSDLFTDPRIQRRPSWGPFPRRFLLIPLMVAEECIGLVAIERHGEFGRAERASAQAMGMEIAIGIEHARLTLRQRRFAEELEAKVAAATQHLRELDQAKSDFVSMTSHELRTPLTAIQGFSELLLAREASVERMRQFHLYIHQEATRLGRIVNDLLDLSRIELGRGVELRRRAVDTLPLLERSVSLFEREAPGHRLICHAEPQLPPVYADPEKLDQIIQNLLSNAIKYSPAGGTIRLVAETAVVPGRVDISISDEGVGIPPESLSRIFEKYYRIRNTATTRVRGLGLGLALVKSLVEAHDGEIRVRSEVGKGSCFVLTLPQHSPATTAAAAHEEERQG